VSAQTWRTPFINDSDANFRVWGKGLSDALAAAGLTQTSDTGQINWATVTAPVASNGVGGYEIWRFNDAAHSTLPIFIKLEYAAGTTTVSRPSMYITVGTASDGAGNISGTTLLPRIQMNGTNNGTTSTVVSFACYNTDTGALWFGLNPVGSPGTGWFFGVFRWADSAGNVGAEGCTILRQVAGSTAVGGNNYRHDLATTSTFSGGWGVPISIGSTVRLAQGSNGPVSHFFGWDLKHRLCPGILGCSTNDFPSGYIMPFAVKEQPARDFIFLPTGSAGGPRGTDFAAGSGAGAGLIYE
jgi:hypothetical protein